MRKNNYLKMVPFSRFNLWDVNRYKKNSIITSNFDVVKLSKIITQIENYEVLESEKEYYLCGISSYGLGMFHREIKKGKEIKAKKLNKINSNQFIYSRLGANNGSFAMVTNEYDNYYVSNEFPTFQVNNELVQIEYLEIIFKISSYWNIISNQLQGAAHKRFKEYLFLNLEIPLPSLIEQAKIVEAYNAQLQLSKEQQLKAKVLEEGIEKYLFEELGIDFKSNSYEKTVGKFIKVYKYSAFDKWGANRNTTNKLTLSKPHLIKKIKDICTVSSGGTPSRDRKEYYKGNIPWIKTGEVINGVIYDTEEKITKEAIENSSAKIYPKNSLIIAMYGQGLTRGRTAKLGIDASTNQACAVLFDIDNSIILTDYLWMYLMGEYDRLRELASGNSQPNLNAQMIKDYNVIIPSLEIQSAIVDNINLSKLKISEFYNLSKRNKEEAIVAFEKEIFN